MPIQLMKLYESGPFLLPLLSSGPGTPVLIPAFCQSLHTAAASWLGSVACLALRHPSSSGWPVDVGVLPGRAGRETAQQLGALVGFLC